MIHQGVAYYPEFWPENTWEEDLRAMKKIGFNSVRLAEFAWASLEPEEGRFDSGWLVRILELTKRQGLSVLLCTPTATPPKWLTHRYPETRVVQPDGQPVSDYGRKYYCPLSPRYRELTGRIIGEMARAAAPFDHVLAWQIDNEMGPHEVGRCFCSCCAENFRDWLRAKYSSLENLNQRWQTAHWSQRISAWEEIDLPTNRTQPAVSLDFCRFGQDAWTGYFNFQKETLRQLGVRSPISTNFMCPIYEALDYWDFARHVDLAMVDHYVGGLAPAASGLALDLIRNLRQQPFWITETGTNGDHGGDPSESEIRLWACRSLARGARGIYYFRWRTCLAGAEDRHPSILTHAHLGTSAVAQVGAVFEEFNRLGEHLDRMPLPDAPVAIVFDWMSMLARSVPWKYMTDAMQAIETHLLAIYSVFFRRGIMCDIVPPDRDLSGYRLVILPGLAASLSSEAITTGLELFAASGGTIVATADLGARDQFNNHYAEPRPLGLTGLFGIEIGETRALRTWKGVWSKASAEPPRAELAGAEGECSEIMESIIVHEAEVLGSFKTGAFRGQPAVTRRRSGKGAAFYAGTVPLGDVLDRLLEEALSTAGIESRMLPEAIEHIACGAYRFYLNSSESEVTLDGLPEGEALLGRAQGSTAVLPPYGVLLLLVG